jgi:hypothetical protein
LTNQTPRLSKSRVQSGAQCPLKLWYDCFKQDLATPVDEFQQIIFDSGTRVGLLAQQRYPGGKPITAEYYETDLALEQTAEAVLDTSIPALFEPAIIHNNVSARVDILQRSGADEWDLIEVKSATKPKDVYLRDLAIQVWIARGAKLPIRKAGLLLLNRAYVYDGENLDLDQLFTFVDLTSEAIAMHDEVGSLVASLQADLVKDEAPQIEPGDQCSTPYPCSYYDHCTRELPVLQHPVENLPRLHAKKLQQLRDEEIDEISDIPDDFPLNETQARVRTAVISGGDWVSEGLAEELAGIEYPVHHLDFEAFMPAIPAFAGTSPFDAVPFQYSIHRQETGGELEHLECLYTEGDDPHRELATRLVSDLGERGSICVYSSYEKTMIKSLSARLPDLQPELDALLTRLWDLLPIVRRHYYHPDFNGSFSIKSVLPALVPELSYEGMAIADGRVAGSMYEKARGMEDDTARGEIFDDLRAYCGQDTLAMVVLRQALAKKV